MGYATDYETGNTYWVDDDDPRKVYTVDGQPVSEVAKYDAAQMSLPFSQRTPYTTTKSQKDTATYDTKKASQALLGQGTAGKVPIPSNEWWEFEPFEWYREQMGIPTLGANPYQKWLQQQFNPLFASYLGTYALTPSAEQPSFSAYATQNNNPFSSAVSAFKNALGGNQSLFWENLGDFGDNFVYALLRNFYPAYIAQNLAKYSNNLYNEYTARNKGETSTFLDYLKDKYNLGSLI